MSSSRTYPEEHPVAAMMGVTALMGASTLKDPQVVRTPRPWTLSDDPDVHWIAEAALDAARQAADSGMDTAGYPLTAGLVLLTMSGPEAHLRVAFAWKDELGRQVAERLGPELVRMAQALGW